MEVMVFFVTTSKDSQLSDNELVELYVKKKRDLIWKCANTECGFYTHSVQTIKICQHGSPLYIIPLCNKCKKEYTELYADIKMFVPLE